MSGTFYRWCLLRNGNTHTKGYIEERGAKLGAKVELLDSDTEGLWEVITVSDSRITREELNKQQKKSRESFPSIK